MIQPAGLTLFFDLPPSTTAAEREITGAALEWCARHANAAVVALLPGDWPNESDSARWPELSVAFDHDQEQNIFGIDGPALNDRPSPNLLISRARGKPHGMSEVEQQIYMLLQADVELATLFQCNQLIDSHRGYQARVDLLWPAGRLVVELDGYQDHSTAAAFERDRHRDYELLLNGYRVLRITNAEVQRDSMGALEKIRDVVRFVRTQGMPSV
jgi:very-short-patch-repair endonuclease